MNRKRIIIIASAVLAFSVVTVGFKFHSDRRASLARAEGCRAALTQTYEQFSRHGPEIARIHTEIMLLGAHRHSEMLLEHPFARWWPPHTRGSYEHPPFWRYPTRRERLARVQSSFIKLQSELGVTNRQQEAELYTKYVEMIQKANTSLNPISGSSIKLPEKD
jgi:hypothetical protein